MSDTWRGPRTYIIRQITPHTWDFIAKKEMSDGTVHFAYPCPRATHFVSRQEAEAWMRFHIGGGGVDSLERDQFEPLTNFSAHYDGDGRLIEEDGEQVVPICQLRAEEVAAQQTGQSGAVSGAETSPQKPTP